MIDKEIIMKLFMQVFAVLMAASLVFMGCSDSDESVALEQEQEAVSDVTEEVDEDVVSDVDSVDDVSMLDVSVEEEDADVSVERGPDVSEEEDPEQLDEDPTSFRSNPNPGSHFFNPEVP
tara:strand:- start:18 stop:377 length:360 start_codon:yes stop_codon:yes gene_type:complete